MIANPLLWLSVGTAVLDWAAVWRKWKHVEWVTKPATMLLLIAFYTLEGGWSGPGIWFGVGLVASLLGDSLLLSERYFLPGLGAFLSAHVLYIISYRPFPLPSSLSTPLVLVGVGLVYAFFIGQVFGKRGVEVRREKMVVPVAVYGLVISIMLASAMLTLLRPEWPLAAGLLAGLGAAAFFLSDSLLAVQRFLHHYKYGDPLVMVLYNLGQVAMTVAVLAHLAAGAK